MDDRWFGLGDRCRYPAELSRDGGLPKCKDSGQLRDEMRISATDMLVQCAIIRVEAASTIKTDSIERVIRSAIWL